MDTRTVEFQGGFTVLMAVYGGDDPALFRRAVDSVFNNTVQPNDFVLVVDGPTPAPLRGVIDGCVSERAIRAIQLPKNVGLANALNEGLREIRTDWVVRADADDVNLPDRFARQAAAVAASERPVDLVGGAILEVDKADEPVAVREVPLAHDGIVERLQTRNPFNHMTVAYRTATALKIGGYPNIHLKEDYGLWASMIAEGAHCANVDAVLVRATAGRDMYRRRGGLRHAKSEWVLQRHLHRLGHKTFAQAVFHGCARAAVSLLPASVRAWLYERHMRQPAAAAIDAGAPVLDAAVQP